MKTIRPKILISSCLLGHKVRYNGGHTKKKWIVNELSKHVDFIPFCPEVELGLGVPREAVHLEIINGEIHLVTSSGESLSNRTHIIKDKLKSIKDEHDISGIILQKRSPSCSLSSALVFKEGGEDFHFYSSGYFLDFFKDVFLDIPIIDSGRINNMDLLDDFLVRTYVVANFHSINKDINSLQLFHREHKYLFMSFDQLILKELGSIASNKSSNLFKDYFDCLLRLLSKNRKKGNLINTITHMLGYYKKDLSLEEKNFVHEMIGKDDFAGVFTLLNYFNNKFRNEYISNQIIFNPYPKELVS